LNDFRRHPFYDRNPECEEALQEWLALTHSHAFICANGHFSEECDEVQMEEHMLWQSMCDELKRHLFRFQEYKDVDDLLDTLAAEYEDLRGVDLNSLDLSAPHRETPLPLGGANLQGAYLAGANLRGGDLSGSNLASSCLQEADLQTAWLDGASLERVDAIIANLTRADLRNADLRNADLRNANLEGANLTDADLRNADLRNADLPGANLTGANLTDANLEGSNITDANLRNANLEGANLTDANLQGADITGARLAGAILSSVNLSGATVRGAQFRRVARSPKSQPNILYRLRSYLSFGKQSSSADLSDATIENVKGGRDTYWPGPLAVSRTHNATIPSLTGARARLAFAFLGSLTAVGVLVDLGLRFTGVL